MSFLTVEDGLDIKIDSPVFAYTQETVCEHKAYLIKITATPPQIPGVSRAGLCINTDHSEFINITIPVEIEVLHEAAIVHTDSVFPGKAPGMEKFTPILIEFFYEQGCSECTSVSNSILQELERRYAGFFMLKHYDTGINDNYLKLITYQNELKSLKNESVYIVADKHYIFSGIKAIESDLFPLVNRLISARRCTPKFEPPEVLYRISQVGLK